MRLFKKLEDSDLELIESYSSLIDTNSYYYKPSFAYLWAEHTNLHLYKGEYGLYQYLKANGTFLMPLSQDMPNALRELKRVAKEENIPILVKSIPDNYSHFFENDRIELTRDRNLDEYIYSKESLETLSGRALQSKRNHISQFMKNYHDYTLERLTVDSKDEVLEMTSLWLSSMPDEYQKMLKAEYITIERAFKYWNNFDLSGAIIRVEGKIIAYTIGEKQDDTIVVHYEKANTSYHGAYAIINREYQRKIAPNALYVNRMEDAGIEGLRKAKESYKPIKMLEKWQAKM